MFTKEQIQQAQSTSKGGKDFPQLVQNFKALGIVLYEHWVGNGANIKNSPGRRNGLSNILFALSRSWC